MNIQELKKMMNARPETKMRHNIPFNKPMPKHKALSKAKEGGHEWKAKVKNQEHRINQIHL